MTDPCFKSVFGDVHTFYLMYPSDVVRYTPCWCGEREYGTKLSDSDVYDVRPKHELDEAERLKEKKAKELVWQSCLENCRTDNVQSFVSDEDPVKALRRFVEEEKARLGDGYFYVSTLIVEACQDNPEFHVRATYL